MKILYGTSNPAKLQDMRMMLAGMDIEIIGLCDVQANVGDVDEPGASPLENARAKALNYHRATGYAAFSVDSGLYIEGLPAHDQPGVYVRRVNGHSLSDEEMIVHYAAIAKRLGGLAPARYQNAISMVMEDGRVIESDDPSLSFSFLLTERIHAGRTPGFPLDSISLDMTTRSYLVDTGGRDDESIRCIQNGFRAFFTRCLHAMGQA